MSMEKGSHSVMVSTLDPDSSDPSSNLGGTVLFGLPLWLSNVGDLGSIPGLGRSSGEGKGYPLQYCGLENSMDSIVHGVAESDTTE